MTGSSVFRKHSETIILGLAMISTVLLMWIFNGSRFLGSGNLQSMAFQLPELGILSLAMMVTMLTAGINLSIIASANLSGIIAALILTQFIQPGSSGFSAALVIFLAILAGLLTSVLVGLLNGLLIARIGVSPILATLGTMILINGFAIVITEGYVISGFPEAVKFIGNGLIFGIPMPIIIFTICAIAMAIVLNRTATGVSIFMIGSNPIATLFSGISNKSVLIKTYLLSGLYAGIAAIIMISRFNSAKADYGESYLLMTVLASVMGGVSAAGGFGRVSGVVIALVILQIVSSGLNLLRVSNFLTIAIWGIILILVMIVKFYTDRYQRRQTT